VMKPDGSGGGESATLVKEATDAAAATVSKKAIDAVVTKEVAAKKMTTNVTVVKKATNDVDARVAMEDSAAKLLRSRQLGKLQRWRRRRRPPRNRWALALLLPQEWGPRELPRRAAPPLLLCGSTTLGCPDM
jgi:hypothetical protein